MALCQILGSICPEYGVSSRRVNKDEVERAFTRDKSGDTANGVTKGPKSTRRTDEEDSVHLGPLAPT
jgi:hypothetical protein